MATASTRSRYNSSLERRNFHDTPQLFLVARGNCSYVTIDEDSVEALVRLIPGYALRIIQAGILDQWP